MQNTLIATVTAAAIALSASTFAREREYEDIFVVKESTEIPTIVVSGSVVPFKEVTLAAQLPGRVKFIAGIEGESFDEGTTLVALDEDELLAKRSAAYAQLAAADPGGVQLGQGVVGRLLAALEAAPPFLVAQLAAADAQMRNAGVQYSRELWSPQSKSGPGGMGMPNLFDQMFTCRPRSSWGSVTAAPSAAPICMPRARGWSRRAAR